MASCLSYLKGEKVPAKQQVDIKIFDATDKKAAQDYVDQITKDGLEF
jgi:ribosomal protein L35AE/L33A